MKTFPTDETEDYCLHYLQHKALYLWDMRAWHKYKDKNEIMAYIENPTHKNDGHAQYCVQQLKELGTDKEKICKAIMDNTNERRYKHRLVPCMATAFLASNVQECPLVSYYEHYGDFCSKVCERGEGWSKEDHKKYIQKEKEERESIEKTKPKEKTTKKKKTKKAKKKTNKKKPTNKPADIEIQKAGIKHALHSFEEADQRWDKLREGATDEELKEHIKYELGQEGGYYGGLDISSDESAKMDISYKGNIKTPWIEVNGVKYKGRELIQRVRQILEIPHKKQKTALFDEI